MRLDEQNLVSYLENAGVLAHGEGASVEPVGRGNLNFVRRVRAPDGRSWVVKQARPGVEGYPDFPLSSERIVFEWRYGEAVRRLVPGRAELLPAVRRFDSWARVLVLEDLGNAPSLDARLRAGDAPLPALRAFGELLAAVHQASARCARELEPEFVNAEMRRLNGAQMFAAPYAEAGPALAPELDAVRREVCADRALRACVADLTARYSSAREALVHGDTKAANVLVQGERPRLIDAEFAHVGDPAFDLGVALAHLVLCTSAPGAAPALEPARAALLDGYRAGGGTDERLERAVGYAGAVVLAHVIGPSRLAFEQTAGALAAARLGRELLLG